MPLVKMLKTAAGPNGTFIAGSRAHLDDETAAAWIAVGSAEAIEEGAPAGEPDAAVEPVSLPKVRASKKTAASVPPDAGDESGEGPSQE